jgi:hypothetical protein
MAAYCEGGSAESGVSRERLLKQPVERAAQPYFPSSYRKLCDMLDAVRRDQFVSFIQ